jgi:hypothetical protein
MAHYLIKYTILRRILNQCYLLVNLMDLQVGPDMAISTFLHLQDQHIKIIPASPSSPS